MNNVLGKSPCLVHLPYMLAEREKEQAVIMKRGKIPDIPAYCATVLMTQLARL